LTRSESNSLATEFFIIAVGVFFEKAMEEIREGKRVTFANINKSSRSGGRKWKIWW
jgi:hypothetical protein